MLKGKLFDKTIKSSDRIEIDPSRCSRRRYNKSLCQRCVKKCAPGAMAIDDSLMIRRESCSACMLCVSECSAGVFEIINGFNFYALLARLRKIPSPMIGCDMQPDLPAHEKTPCFGFLSEEYIIALSVSLQGRLQINLTPCTTCRNGFIVGVLRKRLESVEAKAAIKTMEKIRLVEEKSELDYRGIAYDRRAFFKELKELAARATVSLLDHPHSGGPSGSYARKKLPAQKELLNKILPLLSEEAYREVLKNYYYHVVVDESCNDCFACVRMCPTGALKNNGSVTGRGLFFNPSQCNGCALCASFCRSNSMLVAPGYFGPHPGKYFAAHFPLSKHPPRRSS